MRARQGSQPRLSGILKERRDHLFGAYVDQMFRRRGVGRRYTPLQTVDWLTWLARQMVRHSQTVFYIERLQPDWLPGEQRWAFGLVYRLVAGLVVGLVAGLVNGLLNGLARRAGLRAGQWAVIGLIFGTGRQDCYAGIQMRSYVPKISIGRGWRCQDRIWSSVQAAGWSSGWSSG